MIASQRKQEDWMNSKWRPACAWLYMVTCAFDFIVAPISWGLLQAVTHNNIQQWTPLTLEGAGLYHIAMGAVLGIAAWTRGREKIEILRGGSKRDEWDDDDDYRHRRMDENKWGKR